MKEVSNPILEVLQSTFSKSTISEIESNYFESTSTVKKWTCYSDYCFGDDNKPNDVVTFSLIPYVDNFTELSAFIKSVAATDIKNTQRVTEEFIDFLTKYPAINFSFILNNKKRIFGNNNTEIRKSLEETFSLIKQQYIAWIPNQPEQSETYKLIIKKLNCTINLIKANKKIKQIVEMTLVCFLGAYVSSIILKKTKAEIFGWLSDRDSIHEVCDHLSIDLFHNYLHGLSNQHRFEFIVASATSKDIPFYDELLKIPDYIAGTLADYDYNNNQISKEKFDTVLTNYMAKNTHNNFVFILESIEGALNCSRIKFYKNAE